MFFQTPSFQDIPETACTSVNEPVCTPNKEQECETITVDVEQCQTVYDEECKKVPFKECKTVQEEVCTPAAPSYRSVSLTGVTYWKMEKIILVPLGAVLAIICLKVDANKKVPWIGLSVYAS